MDYILSKDAISEIWKNLQRPLLPGVQDNSRTVHRSILRQGWALSADVTDMLWEKDSWADDAFRHGAFSELPEKLNLKWVSRYEPPYMSKQVVGFRYLSLADLTVLISEIEKFGFSVDPLPIVDAIRPEILKKKSIDDSELLVLWYNRERHKGASRVARSEGGKPDRSETIITSSGYRATALLENGIPVVLRVDPSKNRKAMRLDWWIDMELRRHVVDFGSLARRLDV